MTRVRKLILSITILFLAFTSVPLIANAKAESKGEFWVEYIDVGQGDCALICCDGKYMMIDGGPSSASSVVYTILKNKKIDYIDYMIATHPDADHIGGLSGALNYAKVGTCYSSVTEHDTKTFNSLVKYLGKQNKKMSVPKTGSTFKLGSADVAIIGPVAADDDTNNSSIVVRISYGDNTFLFMGDAETEEEADIIASKVDLKCDVLKIGHHGSSSSTGKSFLNKANPKYAVISVGKENSYGHPTDEVLKRLSGKGIETFRTDLQGDITCVSDGKNLTFTTEKNEPAAVKKDTAKKQEVVAVSGDITYVVNKNTKKFHYPTCSSVTEMKAKNKMETTKTRDELINQGYSPCGRCHP